MHTNIMKLRGKMVELGYSVKTLAAKTGINRATFYRKLKTGGISFTVGEVHKICDALQLTADETACIFLSQNSH
jgi:DNA-binding phage protein